MCVWVVDLVAWTGVADREIDSIHAFGDCFCRIHSTVCAGRAKLQAGKSTNRKNRIWESPTSY